MNDRTSDILEAAIQEFIDTGEPVSSGWLYERYDFGIKPAMIRLELDTLEENGYLEQPYHSAGRVPTDSGYEFYAARALAAEMVLQHVAAAAHATSLKNLLERRALPDLMDRLSSQLGLLSVAIDAAADEVYKTGLEALIENLNWRDREELRLVIHDFESVDDRLSGATKKMENANPKPSDGEKAPKAGELKVFIGKKSPVTESENLSVVCNTYHVGNTTVSIFAIGPKRMDYKKVINLFKNL